MKRTSETPQKPRRVYVAPKVKSSTEFETLAMMCMKTANSPDGECDFTQQTS